MKILFLIGIFIFSFSAFAEDSIEVRCFEKKIAADCEAQAVKIMKNDLKQLKERYRYSFQACVLKAQ